MSDDQPIFHTKIIADDQPKKRMARRHGMTQKNVLPNSKNAKELNDSLVAIYQDDNGKIPNMRQITIKNGHPFLKTLSLVTLGGAAFVILAWAGFIFLPSAGRLSQNEVTLDIGGPDRIDLGATSTYRITYKNNYSGPIKNATLNIYYPAGFVFSDSLPASANVGHNEWKLGTIPAHQEGSITIEGQNYGALSEQKSWRVFLNYEPENFNSQLQKVATLNNAINSSPFSLTVSGPDSAPLGGEVEYTFTVDNTGDWSPATLELAPILPPNFAIASSTPALNKNNRWLINSFSVGETSSTPAIVLKNFIFKLRGQFGDSGSASGTIRGVLYLPVVAAKQNYSVADTSVSSEIIKNNSNFDLAINGSTNDSEIQSSDSLNITLHFKNTGPKDIKNAVVALTISAPSINKQSMLNWPQLVDQNNGDVRGEQVGDSIRKGKITWNSAKIPAFARLKPNDEVSIDIRLPLKDAKSFDFTAIKDFLITAGADVSFTDDARAAQTLSSNPITLTLNSDFKFANRDNVSTNGQGQDQHAISWVLTNSLHPLKNIELSADVFGDVTWAQGSVAAGDITYDAANKKISWKIAEMPESIDVLNASFTLTINKKNPSQNTLLSKVHVQADDAVTGKKFDFLGAEISL